MSFILKFHCLPFIKHLFQSVGRIVPTKSVFE